MRKVLRFFDKIFGLSIMKEGANIIVSDAFPSICKTVRLALSKEGRTQLELARQKAKERIANRPDLRAMDTWFPWTWKGTILLIVGYVSLYFSVLQGSSVWPFDFAWGLAGVSMMCVFGLIALVAVPAIRYRNYN